MRHSALVVLHCLLAPPLSDVRGSSSVVCAPAAGNIVHLITCGCRYCSSYRDTGSAVTGTRRRGLGAMLEAGRRGRGVRVRARGGMSVMCAGKESTRAV